MHYAQVKGYKQGWAAFKFKEKFGDWPSRFTTPKPIAPSHEVLSWIRSQTSLGQRRKAGPHEGAKDQGSVHPPHAGDEGIRVRGAS